MTDYLLFISNILSMKKSKKNCLKTTKKEKN